MFFLALVLLVWLLLAGALGGLGIGSGNTANAAGDSDPAAFYFGYGDSEGGLSVAERAPDPADLDGSGDDPAIERPPVDWWNWGSEQDFCSDNAQDAIYDCLADPTQWGWGG